jgi:hypothetical protein
MIPPFTRPIVGRASSQPSALDRPNATSLIRPTHERIACNLMGSPLPIADSDPNSSFVVRLEPPRRPSQASVPASMVFPCPDHPRPAPLQRTRDLSAATSSSRWYMMLMITNKLLGFELLLTPRLGHLLNSVYRYNHLVFAPFKIHPRQPASKCKPLSHSHGPNGNPQPSALGSRSNSLRCSRMRTRSSSDAWPSLTIRCPFPPRPASSRAFLRFSTTAQRVSHTRTHTSVF